MSESKEPREVEVTYEIRKLEYLGQTRPMTRTLSRWGVYRRPELEAVWVRDFPFRWMALLWVAPRARVIDLPRGPVQVEQSPGERTVIKRRNVAC